MSCYIFLCMCVSPPPRRHMHWHGQGHNLSEVALSDLHHGIGAVELGERAARTMHLCHIVLKA